MIKLLLRCVSLYAAYYDIKKILLLVAQEEEMFQAGDDKDHMFENCTGPIPTIMKNCDDNGNYLE